MNEEKTKKKDNDIVYVFLRRLSIMLAKLLSKTSITPNQVTLGGFIILTPPIIYFLIQGNYFSNLIALALILASVLLDLSDGALARLKAISSNYGAWLDGSLDRVFQFSLFIALIIGNYNNNGSFDYVIVGLILLLGQNIANYMGFCYEKLGFDPYSGSTKFNDKFNACRNEKKFSVVDLYLKNIIVPSNMFFIFFFTCRYLLFFAILVDRIDIFLIIFAITINIRWISMWLLYLKFLSGTGDSLYTIKFLKELQNEETANK